MVSTSGLNLDEFSYLAIVPRGLQSEISYGLRKQARVAAANDPGDHDDTDRGDRDVRNIKDIDDICEELSITTWDAEAETETLREALRTLALQKEDKRKRQTSNPNSSNAVRFQHQPNRTELEAIISSKWLPPRCSVGSVKLSSSGQHVSVGYIPSDQIRYGNDVSNEMPSAFASSWTCTGQLAGSVFLQIETNRRDLSRHVIAPSRLLGPLVALISIQTDNRCLEASTTTATVVDGPKPSPNDRYQRYYKHSLEEMTTEATRHIRSDPDRFSKRFDRAFRVWRDCVEETWRTRLSPSEYSELLDRVRENRLRFRLSCVRVEPAVAPSAYSKKKKKKHLEQQRDLFSYSRQELCRAVLDACGPTLVPDFYNRASGDAADRTGEGSGSWSVDLERFDLELVLFVTPPEVRSNRGRLSFGISLCPHSFLQSKSFATGQLPPDVTAPYIGRYVPIQGIVKLRPTTAHTLLQTADLQECDMVLDPCAGVGTIPVEAECFCRRIDGWRSRGQNHDKPYLSIGGDLILNNPKYTTVAGVMETKSRGKTVVDGTTEHLKSSSLLVAWDAAHLPVRTSSVDVVVSDLPFGQQCLSVTALNQLLPLVFLECARVLTPTTGRMVVLAGGSPITLIANIEKYSGKYWNKPLPRVSPVSIGGILAWIVRADRNLEAFDRDDSKKQLEMTRKLAEKRDRIGRQRKNDGGEQQTKKRRRNAGVNASNHRPKTDGATQVDSD